MDDTLARMFHDLVGRLTGPMTFRLILQPVMASLLGWRNGAADARNGRPPYFWTMFTDANGERNRLLNEGLHAVLRVIVLGIVMELVYQWIVFRWLYPIELVIVVLMLAFVPYMLVRGIANRVVRRQLGKRGVEG
jgi:hypothetical protein